jgi:hypothetical protein
VDLMTSAKFLKATFNIHLVDTKGGFHSRPGGNVLLNYLNAGISEHERLAIMGRMIGGRIHNARKGLPWSGNKPFGRTFDNDSDPRGHERGCAPPARGSPNPSALRRSQPPRTVGLRNPRPSRFVPGNCAPGRSRHKNLRAFRTWAVPPEWPMLVGRIRPSFSRASKRSWGRAEHIRSGRREDRG